MNCHLPEEEKTVANGNLQMNLYDLNKQIISQLPSLTEEQQDVAQNIIGDYIADLDQEFYMLLGRDINYYTLFQTVKGGNEGEVLSTAVEEVWACADYLGEIKSVEETDDGAVEIWVQAREEGSEPMAMYLFGYDGGVIKCVR